jgi:hypothetical protein
MVKIGQEVLFGLDNFHKPKMLSLKDTVAQQIINLLLMRPGNLPSLPHIGINIEQYMYRLQDDFDPEEIKQKIYNQCSELLSYISLGEVQIFITIYKGKDLLIVAIPIVGFGETENLLVAFSSSQNDVNVAYQFEEINSTVNT